MFDDRPPHLLRRPGLDPGSIGINERHGAADRIDPGSPLRFGRGDEGGEGRERRRWTPPGGMKEVSVSRK